MAKEVVKETVNIPCPESTCRFENEVSASECTRCGTPLQGYVRLLDHPAHLFNQGLTRARRGEFEQARDLFAAVVYWCPSDLEARHALAMACLALQDLQEAARQWENVLAQAPADVLAKRGLEEIRQQPVLSTALSAQRPERTSTVSQPVMPPSPTGPARRPLPVSERSRQKKKKR